MASSSAAVTSQDRVKRNLVIIIGDSGASDHYFDDVIIRDLKHRRQDYVHLSTPRKILITGGVLRNGTAKGVLQGLATDNYNNQILVLVDIMVVPGIGRNLVLVTTAAKKSIVTTFD